MIVILIKIATNRLNQGYIEEKVVDDDTLYSLDEPDIFLLTGSRKPNVI